MSMEEGAQFVGASIAEPQSAVASPLEQAT
jgi:hypothetical protein